MSKDIKDIMVTDAHLAALAIEHVCGLASTDSDFARFPKLKWININQRPLARLFPVH